MIVAKARELIKKLSGWYFRKRMLPYWIIMVGDAFIVFLCSLFTYLVANDTQISFETHGSIFLTALLYSCLSLVGARIMRTYSGVLRFSGFVDLIKIAEANIISLFLCIMASLIAEWRGIDSLCALSRIEIFVVFLLSALTMGLSRIVVKMTYDITNQNDHATRVLIYGALNGGVGLAKSIRMQHPVRFELEGFITQERKIKGMKLLGVPVYTMDDDLVGIIKKDRIQAVLVSMERTNDFRANQEIQDILINEGVKIYMAHDAQEASVRDGEIYEGEDKSYQMQEVSVEDLLPRNEIKVDLKSVGEMLTGKRVLITGAAGSIGSEIVRQVAKFKPEKMMLIDQAETPQHDILLMMQNDFPKVPCEVAVTSITYKERMEHIFSEFLPEYVFHAAAYKHVPMMEDNPSEAILNNVLGTKIMADLSVKYKVKRFVMISSDKAVNPTNVMGCSKRLCEIYVQSLDRKVKMDVMSRRPRKNATIEYTQFITTRFGNVLGSNGSVIPLFREQIKNGGPVTVTDERIVRYFMLIPEACRLVLEAGTKGQGGDIFVFDMGRPVKIADLAKRMILLSGAKNIEIKYVGLREGEKLYEEVLSDMEGTKPTFHSKIRIAQVREYDFEEVSKEMDELFEIAKKYDNMETVRKMKQIVPEYRSNNSKYEVLDKERESASAEPANGDKPEAEAPSGGGGRSRQIIDK